MTVSTSPAANAAYPFLYCPHILTCRHDHSLVLDYSAPFLRQTGIDLPSAGQIAGHNASSLTVGFAVKAVSPGCTQRASTQAERRL